MYIVNIKIYKAEHWYKNTIYITYITIESMDSIC